jgi:hypothetical protein
MKILFLHGYQNNSKILIYQSKLLRSLLKYDFVIPNAPNLSHVKPNNINTKFFNPPYFYWYEPNGQGLGNSINYINSLGTFDGIIGFSQGSAMALNMFDIIKPKFFISIAGVNPNIDYFYDIPSYHFIGINDPIKSKSIKLLNMFQNPNVIYFDGRHEFPSLKYKNEFLMCDNFIKNLK